MNNIENVLSGNREIDAHDLETLEARLIALEKGRGFKFAGSGESSPEASLVDGFPLLLRSDDFMANLNLHHSRLLKAVNIHTRISRLERLRA